MTAPDTDAHTGPSVTCPASRHAAMISEALMSGAPYAMLAEAPEHCGASIADTVAALWKARVEVEQLRAALAPFSEEAAYWFSHNYNREDRPVEGFQGYTPVMTCGDLFNARAALAQKGGA